MIKFYRIFVILFLAVLVSSAFILRPSKSAPMLANYYLGTLPTDQASIDYLARNDLLILSPEQGIVRRNVIDQIRAKNPDIILLAYVPSESYNQSWKVYPANTLYKDFVVKDDWWLRDTGGNIVSDWPGLQNTNMTEESTDYLIQYVKSHILSQGIWNGVFWDMVYDGISWQNKGDISLYNNGQRGNADEVNAEWTRRMVYLLDQTWRQLPVEYVLMNGSSLPALQPYTNGRMYEDYPTPWEAGGSWSGIMTGLVRNQAKNKNPQIYVFNANTNNTGKQNDYRRMRFGLASSLIVDDVYFSFDYGTKDHSQVWWYDEYDVDLGDPTGEARGMNGSNQFQSDVWRREYSNGVALVNPTSQAQTVDLGAEYEKIIGKQDSVVNNGQITDRVRIGAKDGLVMLKTTQTLKNVVFNNGSFVRFFDDKGNRTRNGLFVFEDRFKGGAAAFEGDVDGDEGNELITMTGARFEIFDDNLASWGSEFPFGGNYSGGVSLAVSRKNPTALATVALAPTKGNEVRLYTYYGELLTKVYPLGKKYQGGYNVAIGDIDQDGKNEVVVGTGRGVVAELFVYNEDMSKIEKRYKPFNNSYKNGMTVAIGDVNGDSKVELIVASRSGRDPLVKIYKKDFKKVSEFKVASTFNDGNLVTLTTRDMNYDGKEDILVGTQ